MQMIPQGRYHHRPPPSRCTTARDRALRRWFGSCPMAHLGLLLARYRRYPVIDGGRNG